jgi:hypothetical protein
MVVAGIIEGFKHPLGTGLGSTTRAAHKFAPSDTPSGSSEVDISDMFISTGTIGGLLFVVIVFLTVKQSAQFWAQYRHPIGLCIAGVLGITLLNWLAGGRYALTPLVWFLIGSLDRMNTNGQQLTTNETT